MPCGRVLLLRDQQESHTLAKLSLTTLISSGILTTKISDHLPIFTFVGSQCKSPKAKHIKITRRKFNEEHIATLKQILQAHDWSELYNISNVNSAHTYFNNILKRTLDNICPLKTSIIPTKHMIREPWMTVGLLKSSSTLDKLFRRSSGRPTGHPTQIKHKQYRTRQSEMADLARRATSVCTKFHRDRLRNG